MKSSKLILALWLLGASSWAQTLPQQRPVNAPLEAKSPLAARPMVANSGSPRNAGIRSGQSDKLPVPAKPAAAVKPASKSHARSTAQFYGRKPKSKSRDAAQPPSTLAAEAKPKTKVQRDPFVSPVVERVREVATCSGTGRQCLLVGEVSLRGVVRSPSGPIAVVVNGDHTYFLRENDPLADGAVERITNDAIVLRERSPDAVGRMVTHEVTKKLGVISTF